EQNICNMRTSIYFTQNEIKGKKGIIKNKFK
ncbi:hypothetical protein, partial [Plasmodium yoelii yoelii]